MIEREKKYLAKYIPEGLSNCRSKEITDVYIPVSEEHPILRIRKNGKTHEITKKTPVSGTDSSEQIEQTVPLTAEEFASLSTVSGKCLEKQRYYYDYQGRTAEVDIFQGDLSGLVIVDFEFDTSDEKDKFEIPDFCLVDVTQEKAFAGGILSGKKYTDIEPHLKRYHYVPLSI